MTPTYKCIIFLILAPSLLPSTRIQVEYIAVYNTVYIAVSMHSCKACKFRLPTASFAPYGLNHSAASVKF